MLIHIVKVSVHCFVPKQLYQSQAQYSQSKCCQSQYLHYHWMFEWVGIHLSFAMELPAPCWLTILCEIPAQTFTPTPLFDGFSHFLFVLKSSCFSLHSPCRSFVSKSFSLIVHRALLISQHRLLEKIGSSLPYKKYIVIFLQRFLS